MTTGTVIEDQDAVSEDELARLGSAWDGFLAAVRRARARGGERDDGLLTLSQYEFIRPLIGGNGLPVGRLAEMSGIAPATARLLRHLADVIAEL
jgi:hypothetical protein